MQHEEDFTVFSPLDTMEKKKVTQQVASCVPSEAKQNGAHTLELMLTEQATIKQIFAKI